MRELKSEIIKTPQRKWLFENLGLVKKVKAKLYAYVDRHSYVKTYTVWGKDLHDEIVKEDVQIVQRDRLADFLCNLLLMPKIPTVGKIQFKSIGLKEEEWDTN